MLKSAATRAISHIDVSTIAPTTAFHAAHPVANVGTDDNDYIINGSVASAQTVKIVVQGPHPRQIAAIQCCSCAFLTIAPFRDRDGRKSCWLSDGWLRPGGLLADDHQPTDAISDC
jgi:hypothetical protein